MDPVLPLLLPLDPVLPEEPEPVVDPVLFPVPVPVPVPVVEPVLVVPVDEQLEPPLKA